LFVGRRCDSCVALPDTCCRCPARKGRRPHRCAASPARRPSARIQCARPTGSQSSSMHEYDPAGELTPRVRLPIVSADIRVPLPPPCSHTATIAYLGGRILHGPYSFPPGCSSDTRGTSPRGTSTRMDARGVGTDRAAGLTADDNADPADAVVCRKVTSPRLARNNHSKMGDDTRGILSRSHYSRRFELLIRHCRALQPSLTHARNPAAPTSDVAARRAGFPTVSGGSALSPVGTKIWAAVFCARPLPTKAMIALPELGCGCAAAVGATEK